MPTNLIEAQRAAYRGNFIANGDTPQGVFLNDAVTQELRFARLLMNLDPQPGQSLHDVGSGASALYTYLLKIGAALDYSGTEIVQEMIDLVARKHPGVTILNRDLLDATDHYDFLVQSGAFNLPGEVPEPEWREWVFAVIGKMFDMCRVGIAFNFLTAYRTFTDPRLFYLDPREAFDFAATLSPHVTLDAGYPLYECTVTIRR